VTVVLLFELKELWNEKIAKVLVNSVNLCQASEEQCQPVLDFIDSEDFAGAGFPRSGQTGRDVEGP
jgi:hypothetical protein